MPTLIRNRLFWPAIILPALLLGVIYHHSLAYMLHVWSVNDNYGHGVLVPFISLYLIWQKRIELQGLKMDGSWWGVVVVAAGMGLYVVGELATLYALLLLSLWVVVVGLVLSAVGPRGVRAISFPLGYLLLMIPLPDFVFQSLSQQLQLISSALGVGCLQVIGITAFREGNVIDLGPIQLQVVEACSGLRYLFPLAALALLCAYLFQGRMWKRVVLFLSSFPISIFLNGFRIGMIGVLVEYHGQGAAEGFYHFFEGWLLFVASLLLLLVEMWLLARIGAGAAPGSIFDLFAPGVEGTVSRPEAMTAGAARPAVGIAPAYLLSVALFVPMGIVSTQMVAREEVPPPRQSFADFPMTMGAWRGKPFAMEKLYVDALRFDDYLLADYRTADVSPINVYVAYYRSQKKGESAHSPRTCIPGGGWEITSLRSIQLDDAASPGDPLQVNRVLIQKGEQKQVVFYWFQQRGRHLTNEYLVKFYLFWDALTRRRTDGALVRLTAPVGRGENGSVADERLAAFAKLVRPRLAHYVPN